MNKGVGEQSSVHLELTRTYYTPCMVSKMLLYAVLQVIWQQDVVSRIWNVFIRTAKGNRNAPCKQQIDGLVILVEELRSIWKLNLSAYSTQIVGLTFSI